MDTPNRNYILRVVAEQVRLDPRVMADEIDRQVGEATEGMAVNDIHKRTGRAVTAVLRALGTAEGELRPLHYTVQNVMAMSAIRLHATLNNVPPETVARRVVGYIASRAADACMGIITGENINDVLDRDPPSSIAFALTDVTDVIKEELGYTPY